MKIIVSFLLIPWLLFSQGFDSRLMEIETALFEKIIFLDYDIKKKLVQNRAEIYIVYKTKRQKRVADKAAEILDGRKFHDIPIKAHAVAFDMLQKRDTPTVYIAVLSSKDIQKLLQIAVKNHRLLFTYDPDNISHAMVSLQMDAKITPIVNSDMLKQANIELRPIIFKVAKIYRNAS